MAILAPKSEEPAVQKLYLHLVLQKKDAALIFSNSIQEFFQSPIFRRGFFLEAF
jgi:hypothetical protein